MRFPFSKLFRKNTLVPIPVYHITTNVLDSTSINEHSHNVTPVNLRAQLEQLKRKYTIVPLDEMVDRFLAGKNLGRITAVTYDDGYRSVLEEAAPVFYDLRVPFTFFLNGKIIREKIFWRDRVRTLIATGRVDEFVRESGLPFPHEAFYRMSKSPSINSRGMEEAITTWLHRRGMDVPESRLYCDWSDLASAGQYITFGNHSYSHYVLSSLSEEEQYHEIALNKKLLKEKVGSESSVFSIPFGNAGTYNDTTLKIIHDLGYKGYVLSGSLKHCRNFTRDKFGLVRINRFMPADQPTMPGV